MWVLVLFDLPCQTATQRRHYGRFRKRLLMSGFEPLQKSVYVRWEETDMSAATLRMSSLRQAPQEGRLTVMSLTHRTFSLASTTIDGELQSPRQKPDQFLVFD